MTRQLLLAGLLGLVVGALVVGVIWYGSGSSNPVTGTQSITLPGSIGEFVPFGDVELNKAGRGKDNIARVESWDEQSSQRLSKATGAAATVRAYADKDLRNQLSVMAYRAKANPNPPYVPYQDANSLGLVRPTDEVEQFSSVSCVLRNDPTSVGQSPSLNSTHTTSCVRTGTALTVEIRPTGDISNEPQRVAQLVDEVYQTLG
ncbi:hypothetical protein ACFQ1S_25540 [Kibdelosporangium lantanae]|uniref:PknH-like extracellular domain-containing protein n=1 Tax=Kibdelosporangium lantanae TaxID=1497396 RepID=A0ABW3MF82_9PSEU